jgi:hypothetical protein
LFKLQTSEGCGGGPLISKTNDASRHLNNHNPRTASSGYLKKPKFVFVLGLHRINLGFISNPLNNYKLEFV